MVPERVTVPALWAAPSSPNQGTGSIGLVFQP